MTRRSNPRAPVVPAYVNQQQPNVLMSGQAHQNMATAIAALWYQHGGNKHTWPSVTARYAPTCRITSAGSATTFSVETGTANEWQVPFLAQKSFDSIRMTAVLATQDVGPGVKVRFKVSTATDSMTTAYSGWISVNRGQFMITSAPWVSDWIFVVDGDTGASAVEPQPWRRTVVSALVTPTYPASRIVGLGMEGYYTDATGFESAITDKVIKIFEMTAEDRIKVIEDGN